MIASITAVHVYAERGTEIHSCSDVSSMQTSSMKRVLTHACDNDVEFADLLSWVVNTGDFSGAVYTANKFTVKQAVQTSLGTIIISTNVYSCTDIDNLWYSDDTKTVLQDACSNGDLVNDLIDALENADAWFNADWGGWVVWPKP